MAPGKNFARAASYSYHVLLSWEKKLLQESECQIIFLILILGFAVGFVNNLAHQRQTVVIYWCHKKVSSFHLSLLWQCTHGLNLTHMTWNGGCCSGECTTAYQVPLHNGNAVPIKGGHRIISLHQVPSAEYHWDFVWRPVNNDHSFMPILRKHYHSFMPILRKDDEGKWHCLIDLPSTSLRSSSCTSNTNDHPVQIIRSWASPWRRRRLAAGLSFHRPRPRLPCYENSNRIAKPLFGDTSYNANTRGPLAWQPWSCKSETGHDRVMSWPTLPPLLEHLHHHG